MLFFRTISNIFHVEDLRRKIGYTLAVLLVFRLGKLIPLPGINLAFLSDFQNAFAGGGFLSLINLISGGALGNCAIFSLGIQPYISASIAMQFLVLSFPYLEALSKEGESGRAMINQYTRYLAFGVSLLQASMLLGYYENALGAQLFLAPTWWFRIKTVMVLSAGSMFVMWMGEQITRSGIGQGSSMLVFASIVANLPTALLHLANQVNYGDVSVVTVFFVGLFVLALTACVVFLEKGERRIPVHYARKVLGGSGRMLGNVASYIPFKINSTGVMPVILTAPLLSAFCFGVKFVLNKLIPGSSWVGILDQGTVWYSLLMAALIIWFNLIYTSQIALNPLELADNLRKSNGFLPGIRPGQKTAEFFDFVLTRIGVAGSIYMAALAVLPDWILYWFSVGIGATGLGLSLLLSVSIALDTASQVEAYLLESRYEGFLGTFSKTGNRLLAKLPGRRGV